MNVSELLTWDGRGTSSGVSHWLGVGEKNLIDRRVSRQVVREGLDILENSEELDVL